MHLYLSPKYCSIFLHLAGDSTINNVVIIIILKYKFIYFYNIIYRLYNARIRLNNNTHKGIRIKNTPNRKNSDLLVIIQWSCDPPPEESTSDILIEKRREIDEIGRNNANHFLSFLPRKRQSLLETTKKFKQKDFTVVREGMVYPSTFWENPNQNIWEKKSIL